MPPDPVTLAIRDDEAAPAAALVLAPEAIDEDGGVSRVTARLDRPSGADTVVTIMATPVPAAEADDYRLSANTALTIPAGAAESDGRW